MVRPYLLSELRKLNIRCMESRVVNIATSGALLCLSAMVFFVYSEGFGFYVGLVLQCLVGWLGYYWCVKIATRERDVYKETMGMMRVADQSRKLVYSLIPENVMTRLVHGGLRSGLIGESISNCTIMFCSLEPQDILKAKSSADVFETLDVVFEKFDDAVARYGMYKYQHVGDWYIITCPRAAMPFDRPVQERPYPGMYYRKMCQLASELVCIAKMQKIEDLQLGLKVGIHCGAAAGAVIGKHRSFYCVYGDTTNTAARMCKYAEVNQILCSAKFASALAEHSDLPGELSVMARGEKLVKGKGLMTVFEVVREQQPCESKIGKPPGLSWKSKLYKSESPTTVDVEEFNDEILELELRKEKWKASRGEMLDKDEELTSAISSQQFLKEQAFDLWIGFEMQLIAHWGALAISYCHGGWFGLLLHSSHMLAIFALCYFCWEHLSKMLILRHPQGEWIVTVHPITALVLLLLRLLFTPPVWIFLYVAGSAFMSTHFVFDSLPLPKFAGLWSVNSVVLAAVMWIRKPTGRELHLYLLVTLLVLLLDWFRSSTLRFCSRRRRKLYKLIEFELCKFKEVLVDLVPSKVAHQMVHTSFKMPCMMKRAVVLQLDICRFTSMSQTMSPLQIAEMVHHIFSQFDEEVMEKKLFKIDTVGDAYMVAGWLPCDRDWYLKEVTQASCFAMLELARKMLRVMADYRREKGCDVGCRIGISVGVVASGILGRKQSRFHVVGQAMRDVEMLEQNAMENSVHVSDKFLQGLAILQREDDAKLYERLPRGRSMSVYPVCRKELEEEETRVRSEEDEDEDEEEEKEKDAASSSSQEEERKDKSTPMASVRKRRKSSWKQKVLEEQLRCLVGWKCLNAKDWGSVKEDGEGRTEVQAPAAAAAPVEGFARSRSVDHQMKGSFMLFPEGIPRS